MCTKEKFLKILVGNQDKYVSGERIAEELGVSRNAVWKAAQKLAQEGYKIDSVRNLGYRLVDDNDVLSSAGITVHLNAPVTLHVHDTLESTNIVAKELASRKAQHGTTVTAQRQTSGKGRYGRDFASPDGGIYMSVVLHTHELGLAAPALVTALTAVAVCEAIESLCEKTPQIKWVNDVFLGSKKVCGISAEAVTDFISGAVSWIVVGIGVNFSTPVSDFPKELQNIAGSVFGEGETPTVTRNRLIAGILNNLLNPQEFDIGQYQRRIMHLGKKVVVLPENYEAVALGINHTGGLIVRRQSDGVIMTLCSGEISIRVK
jgi:BirA family biotin operon repressor/biotin-[acetyl-CoA-carboxylase] ligase